MRFAPGDTVESIIDLYDSACERSRRTVSACMTLSQTAVVPSFGVGPVNLRWILVHMIDETRLDSLCALGLSKRPYCLHVVGMTRR